MNMDIFFKILWILLIVSASVGLWMFFGSLTSDTEKKNRENSSVKAEKPKGLLSGWWTSHGDTIKSLGYVALALTVINVLCDKIGFRGWERVYEHEGFWWFNASLLLTVLLVMIAKKPVVKWFAGLITFIVLVGVGLVWFSTPSPTSQSASTQQSISMVEVRYSVKSGEVSKAFICDDIVSWTNIPVYLRFNGTGDWKSWERPGLKVPADTNTIEIKADRSDIVVIVREPRPTA